MGNESLAADEQEGITTLAWSAKGFFFLNYEKMKWKGCKAPILRWRHPKPLCVHINVTPALLLNSNRPIKWHKAQPKDNIILRGFSVSTRFVGFSLKNRLWLWQMTFDFVCVGTTWPWVSKRMLLDTKTTLFIR